MYMYVYVCIYIYIYIQRERERIDRQTDRQTDRWRPPIGAMLIGSKWFVNAHLCARLPLGSPRCAPGQRACPGLQCHVIT